MIHRLYRRQETLKWICQSLHALTVSYLPHYYSYSVLREFLVDERIAETVRKYIPDIDQKKGAVFAMKLSA